jgi:hypothetical protein
MRVFTTRMDATLRSAPSLAGLAERATVAPRGGLGGELIEKSATPLSERQP